MAQIHVVAIGVYPSHCSMIPVGLTGNELHVPPSLGQWICGSPQQGDCRSPFHFPGTLYSV